MMTPEHQNSSTTTTISSSSEAVATTTIVTDREGNSTSTTEREQSHEHQVSASEQACLVGSIQRIPHLLNKDDVIHMINLQVTAIDRLESTNRSLVNCNTLAQAKLATTTRLFKKTAKQMCEAKRDLDFVYRRITDLKNKIKTTKSHLPVVTAASKKTTKPAEQTVSSGSEPDTTSNETEHDSVDKTNMVLKQ